MSGGGGRGEGHADVDDGGDGDGGDGGEEPANITRCFPQVITDLLSYIKHLSDFP